MDSNGLSVERYPCVYLCDCPTSLILRFRQLFLRQRFENCQLSNVTLPITFITGPNGQMASQWPLPPSTCFSFTFYATIWILFFLVLWLSCTQQHQPRSPISFSIQFRYRFWSLWEIFRSIPTSEYYLTRSKNKAIRSFRWFLIPLRNLQKYSYFRILSHEIEQHGNTSVCWTGTISCLSRSRPLWEIFRSIPTSE